MKYLWKRATGLLLTSALVLGLAACGGTPTGNTNPPEDPGTQQTTQPVAPDSGAAGEKLVYSNGGPEEFFETPWLNPGTYVYNKAVYGHLIVADENLNPMIALFSVLAVLMASFLVDILTAVLDPRVKLE